MSVMHIDQSNFENEVLKSDRPVLVDFWAPWCGPCRMLAPILEEVAAEHPEYKIAKVNVDEVPALAEQFAVMSIPTMYVFRGGEAVKQQVGLVSKAQLLELLS